MRRRMDVTLRRICEVAVTNLATNLRRRGDVADSSCAHWLTIKKTIQNADQWHLPPLALLIGVEIEI